MRSKTLCVIVTFHTTAESMAFEKTCKTRGIKGKLISAPREFSADCGIAWCSEVSLRPEIEKAIAETNLETHGIHELMR